MFSLQVSRYCYFCSAFTFPLLLSCSSTGPTDQGDDGQPATGGGSSETGGAPGTGGAAATGGDAGTGGDAATGGAPSTGGDSATGGDAATGGEPAVDPALEALLLEGVGDIEKPPPYEYSPYAQRRDDVPHGTVQEFTFDEDAFYPDSPARGIKVYEPAQFEEGEEAFLSVFFDGTANWAYLSNNSDGGTYRTLNVLDNLIADL